MNIREIRKSKKLSCMDVARKLGISHVTVANWELGISEPGASAVIALSEVYEVEVMDILKSLPKKKIEEKRNARI